MCYVGAMGIITTFWAYQVGIADNILIKLMVTLLYYYIIYLLSMC